MPPSWHALTIRANGGLLRALITECSVSTPYDPASPPTPLPPWCNFKAVWDTGATNSVITQPVVDACSLQPTGMIQNQSAHGLKTVPQYTVNIRLPNRVGFSAVPVTLAELGPGAQVLIGMDIIAQGDFAVTNHNGITVMSYRSPSQAHIDYVEVHNEKLRKEQLSHGPGKRKKKNKKR